MVGTTRQFVIAIVLASLVGVIATFCLAAAECATEFPERATNSTIQANTP
ncbi:MAG TPA: hypothetical protein VG247_10580 [Pseudonocardiaceae bacterium]|jgi:hypothetical protein|nr:hypothetical protein [Pseudonocardiaceae bacterium]